MPSSINSSVSSVRSDRHRNDTGPNEVLSTKNYIVTTVDDLKQAFSDSPDMSKGTLKGVAFVGGRYQENGQDNYLFSLDAKDSVIVTLYNREKKKGVVHHFDEKKNMVKELRKSIDFLGGLRYSERIDAHLVGGIWFGAGEKLGECIRETLQGYQIDAAWKEWSFTPCYGHQYGAILHLKNGDLTVFEHTSEVANDFRRNKWDDAQRNSALAVERGSSSSDISNADTSYSMNRYARSLSVNSAYSVNSYRDNDDEIKALKNSVGDINYSLVGQGRYVKKFRNAFNEKIDGIRGELAKKSHAEIKAFLEGVKQALPGEENIELEILRPPRRDRLSVSSSQDETSVFSTDSLTDSKEMTLKAIFTNRYLNQEASFSEEQKAVVQKNANQIIDTASSGAWSNAHAAELFSFSKSDQKKIADEYGDKTTQLFSVPLTGWEVSDRGRGKWRLLYKRQEDGIRFFGIYDTHRRPFVAYA